MLCFPSLIFLFLPVLSVSAAVTLVVGPQAAVFVPTEVKWTRERGDPRVFDLRYIRDGADKGLAVTVRAEKGSRSGTVPVTFPSEGQFELKAVDYVKDDQVIATSQAILVSFDAPNPPEPSTTPVSTQVPPPPTSSNTVTSTFTTPATTSPPNIPSTNATTSPPSTSTSSTSTPTIATTGASSKSAPRTAAIVGGVVGGIAIVGLLVLLLIFLKRRRDSTRTKRRLTFHRDLMVQHRPMHGDLERGPTPVLPPLGFQRPTTVPTPRGPTRPHFPASAIAMPVPEPAPTHRQMQLDDRIRQLEQQITGMRRQNRGQAGLASVLEQMRVQVGWLMAQRNSPWALGETDVPPPQLDLYME